MRYAAYDLDQDWKLSRVTKLFIDPRLDKEGQLRLDQYCDSRQRLTVHRKVFNRHISNCTADGTTFTCPLTRTERELYV